MMITKRSIPGLVTSALLVLSCTALIPSSALAADAVKIKFGHVIPTGDTQDVAYRYFADILKDRSDGRIQVETYPDSQLGGERELVEAVQAGTIEMTAPSVGVVANFDPVFEVFDFPFIFKDAATAYRVVDSDIGTELAQKLEKSDLKLLGWGENGFRNLAMKNETVRTPDQMKGQKLRTMQVPLHIAYWKSVGAAPTPVSFPEVFSALQQGVVVGVENPFELLYSAKLTEPAKYLTVTNHIYDPEPILINKGFFDSLSADDQALITQAADEMVQKLRSLKAEATEQAIKNIEAQGGTVTALTDAEHQLWVESAVPFYKEYSSKVDTAMLKRLLEAADNPRFVEVID
ncbi:TRAP transporter substrate-binding protein [Castellaniella sp.]|uniref:TRAP transporter substrate-binding protein n=1 Tax=Castellaniella sp. TaxID=1955812 RepID=UPI0035606FD7